MTALERVGRAAVPVVRCQLPGLEVVVGLATLGVDDWWARRADRALANRSAPATATDLAVR